MCASRSKTTTGFFPPVSCPEAKMGIAPRLASMTVENASTRALIQRWREHNAIVREYQFGRDIGPLHDIIGPYQPAARVHLVYPVVFDLIDLIDSTGARAHDAPT